MLSPPPAETGIPAGIHGNEFQRLRPVSLHPGRAGLELRGFPDGPGHHAGGRQQEGTFLQGPPAQGSGLRLQKEMGRESGDRMT